MFQHNNLLSCHSFSISLSCHFSQSATASSHRCILRRFEPKSLRRRQPAFEQGYTKNKFILVKCMTHGFLHINILNSRLREQPSVQGNNLPCRAALHHPSVLKLFTGFVIAAFKAFILIVDSAIAKVIKAAKTKIHQLNVVL